MEENVSPPEVKNTNCKNCNIALLPTRKNFCSYKCKWDFMNRRWELNCAFCGKLFILPLGRRSHYRKAKDGTKTFCSRQCWCSWWSANAKIVRANKIK